MVGGSCYWPLQCRYAAAVFATASVLFSEQRRARPSINDVIGIKHVRENKTTRKDNGTSSGGPQDTGWGVLSYPLWTGDGMGGGAGGCQWRSTVHQYVLQVHRVDTANTHNQQHPVSTPGQHTFSREEHTVSTHGQHRCVFLPYMHPGKRP